MSDKKPPFRYIGLPTGLSDGKAPRLQFATPAGLIREVPLDRKQLVSIIQQAASALAVMDKEESR